MKEKRGLHFRARCLKCSWISHPSCGPVFAGGYGIKHVDTEHPEVEGIVAVIEDDRIVSVNPEAICLRWNNEGC